ncbi:MAG: class E sortase, partial [Acidimicrobiales bacterium]
LTEQNHQAQLKKQFDRALQHRATVPAPVPTSPTSAAATGDAPVVGGGSAGAAPAEAAPGGAIDHMIIPKIGVDKFVVEGTNEANLTQGPGHYPGTPLPGQTGNSAIAGHRTTYGAPFFRLDALGPGDDIYLKDTSGQKFRYQVFQSLVVPPNDISVLSATPDAELTLTTCNPRFSATSRLIVKAKLVGLPAAPVAAATPKPVPPTGGTAQPTPATLGSGNQGAWPPALAYGAGVVVLWALVRLAINRTRRARRLGAFVLGIGICLVPLWFCFENVVRLLPQNI